MIATKMPDVLPNGKVVSVIIKTLNEEKNIATAIESSLLAIDGVNGEVIVADSCSTDRTVEIASQYQVRVVQLVNPQEKCCGVGPQLGYQHSFGEFVYILDGDMRFRDGFFEAALQFMQTHPQVGGVGGRVLEMNTSSLEYISRVERNAGHMEMGEVDRLDMGGLYRRGAIESVGYFSDRNLHSYEELDLALRLRANGWILWRLDIDAVQHTGHDAPPYRLLLKRWRSRYICGLGELLRAASSDDQVRPVLKVVRELRIYAATVIWWLMIIFLIVIATRFPLAWIVAAALALSPFLGMGLRKRSIKKAVFSVVSWNFNTLGLLRGFFAPRVSPRAVINSIVVSDKVAVLDGSTT